MHAHLSLYTKSIVKGLDFDISKSFLTFYFINMSISCPDFLNVLEINQKMHIEKPMSGQGVDSFRYI